MAGLIGDVEALDILCGDTLTVHFTHQTSKTVGKIVERGTCSKVRLTL